MGVYIILWPYATFSCVLIAPIGFEGPVTSSYIESVCIVFTALLSSSSSTLASFFALFLSWDIMIITVVNTATQTIKAAARAPIEAVYTVSVDEVSVG